MSSTSGACTKTLWSGPMRSAFAQSTATSVRCAASAGGSRRRPSSWRKWYSAGIGASPRRSISTSLPIWRSASVVASSEPSASPSGFSCVTTRNLSCSRSASTIALRSVIFGGQLVDQLAHPHAPLDRRIVFEGQLRRPLHSELSREARLQHAVCGLEAAHRRRLLLLVSEHADVDGRMPEIRRGDDARHRDEADPRVLELGERLREHLAD